MFNSCWFEFFVFLVIVGSNSRNWSKNCSASGRLNILINGLSCVGHRDDRDRLVFDGRPTNPGDRRLKWARLPLGVMFTRLVLKLGFGIRGRGDAWRRIRRGMIWGCCMGEWGLDVWAGELG